MEPAELLKKYFGYDTFRPMQEDVIKTILSGRDVLAVMPTGAGKSVCFQIPALLFPRYDYYFSFDFSHERPGGSACRAGDFRVLCKLHRAF